MSQFLQWIGAGWLACGFISFVIFVLTRTARGKSRPVGIERKIISWDTDVPNEAVIRLECGHEILLAHRRPESFHCSVCANEIQALKKMAGEI